MLLGLPTCSSEARLGQRCKKMLKMMMNRLSNLKGYKNDSLKPSVASNKFTKKRGWDSLIQRCGAVAAPGSSPWHDLQENVLRIHFFFLSCSHPPALAASGHRWKICRVLRPRRVPAVSPRPNHHRQHVPRVQRYCQLLPHRPGHTQAL